MAAGGKPPARLLHQEETTIMCSVYVHADPIQYEARTRSIRINNVLTTIRLENLFWDVLAEIAGREGKTTNQMIATLHEELYGLRELIPNFMPTPRSTPRCAPPSWRKPPARCVTDSADAKRRFRRRRDRHAVRPSRKFNAWARFILCGTARLLLAKTTMTC
jgi:predicted DNA-binding ribbon-helix-helix protein